MSRVKDEPGQAVPVTAAVCGLPCEVCSIYIASREDPKRLAFIAARWGQSVEETYCEGCRAEKRTVYCRSCNLFACAAGRGHTFCGQCDDYPCSELDEFRGQGPHRAEIYENLARMGEIGAKAWAHEVKSRYTCPSCGTLNSAYDLKCRSCGREPANDFVTTHREAIAQRLSQM